MVAVKMEKIIDVLGLIKAYLSIPAWWYLYLYDYFSYAPSPL